MKTLKIRLFIALIFSIQVGVSQEIWSLEKCIQYAFTHNANVLQAEEQIKNAQLGVTEADFSRYPTLSANTGLGFNMGRAVNPSTNVFESSNANFNQYTIQGSVLLYNGGRLQQEYKRANMDATVAQFERAQTLQSLSLQLTQAYLYVLLNEEQVVIAKKQWGQYQQQLERIENLIRVGSMSSATRYDVQAQMARTEQQIAIATNNVEMGRSNLKNLMQMSSENVLKLEKPSLVVPSETSLPSFTTQTLYNAALAHQAQIKVSEWHVKAAEMGVKISKTSLLPSIFLQSSLASNYSNLITDDAKARIAGVQEKTEIVKIDGRTAKVTSSNPILTMPIKSYGRQLLNNFNQSVAINVSLPIFDGFTRKIAVKRAQIRVEQKKIQCEQVKMGLQTEVQNALNSVKTAQKIYVAAQKLCAAQKVIYEAADNRFQVGNTNLYELSQTKNQLDISERDLVIAKYDYLFKLKVLDYYQGKM